MSSSPRWKQRRGKSVSRAELPSGRMVDSGMRAMNPLPTPEQRLADRSHPDGMVVLKQRWEQLLFLHWRWDADLVQATLPPGLTVDTCEGAAWLGLVPLFMRNVHPRFVPAVPW